MKQKEKGSKKNEKNPPKMKEKKTQPHQKSKENLKGKYIIAGYQSMNVITIFSLVLFSAEGRQSNWRQQKDLFRVQRPRVFLGQIASIDPCPGTQSKGALSNVHQNQ